MDLSSVEEQLKRGLYKNAPELARDIRLTFSNALVYNRPRNPIHDAVSQCSETHARCVLGSSTKCSSLCGAFQALVVLSIFEGVWDKLCTLYPQSGDCESLEEQWQLRTDDGSESGSVSAALVGFRHFALNDLCIGDYVP